MWSKSYIIGNVISLTLFATIVRTALNLDSVETLLADYGTYHQDRKNQLIHFFGVPMILWSALICLAHIDLPFIFKFIHIPSVLPWIPSHPINWATIFTIFYVVFNCHLDPFGGTAYVGVLYPMYASAIRLTALDRDQSNVNQRRKKTIPAKQNMKSLKLAIFIHLSGWYVQIHPGHMIFEGAKPALAESMGMALTAAPLFAFYEGLWLFGVNESLQDDTLKLIQLKTQTLCSNGEKMRICANYE